MRLQKHTYLLCIFFFCVHSQVWAVNIQNIRIGTKKLFTRIVFDLSDKPDIYNIKYMTSPDRIILDFTKGSINQQAIKSTSAYPLIKKINGFNIRNKGFSLEVELQQAANFKHFVLPATNKVGHRLVLDITPGEHRFTTTPQTIIPQVKNKEQNKKPTNNITNYKSDTVKLYDNKVLSDATIEQLFQPLLDNTQLRNPYYKSPLIKKKKVKEVTSNVPHFNIRGYKIKGNTLLSVDILKKSIAFHTGKNKNFSDVQHALESLEQSYKKKGYGMVQVYLPEQELDKGIIIFNVIEPKISTLTVQGANHFNLENIEKSIVSLDKGKTPNTKEIAKNLTLINENPAKKTTVQFIASDEDGLLNALVNVDDKNPSTYSISADNTGSKSTGELRLGLAYQHANITNNDDIFNLHDTFSEKSNALNAYSFGYHIPLYNLNSSVDVFAGYSDVDSGIIQNIYKVSGKGTVFGARYNQILSRKDNYTHRISYGLDYRNYETNAVFVFGGGSLIPDIKVKPLSITYTGQWTSTGKATGFNIQFHYNAFTNDTDDIKFNSSRTGAKANYTIFRFGVEHARAFSKNWQMRLALTGQQTSNALISGEQFGVGGANSVRGYNERDVSDDKGLQATAEVYTPNFAKTLNIEGDIRALFFYDTGQVSRNLPQPGETTSSSISSFGVGIRLNYMNNLTFKLDIAQAQKATVTQVKGETKLHAALKYTF